MPTNGFSESTSCRKPTVKVVWLGVAAADADVDAAAEGDDESAYAAVGTSTMARAASPATSRLVLIRRGRAGLMNVS